SELVSAVQNWQARADLAARVPEGIVLAEAKINRRLRTPEMVVRNQAFQILGEYTPVPVGFGGVKMWHLNDSPRSVIFPMSEDEMTTKYGDGTAGNPIHFCVQGKDFRLQPASSTTQSSTLVYYMQVPALTASNPVNWLLTLHPDVYLYGVNAEMSAFAKDFDAAQGWKAEMYQIL